MDIGRCPHCENILTEEDIRETRFRGTLHTHHAYMCKKCETIIGFSSAQP